MNYAACGPLIETPSKARPPAGRAGAWVSTLWEGVGASITYAGEPSAHALIRPGLRPAHLQS